MQRTVHIVNLDPAAESFNYPVAMGTLSANRFLISDILLWVFDLNYVMADIRELISLDDVMEELGLGPNGGLIYCMEYPLAWLVFDGVDLLAAIIFYLWGSWLWNEDVFNQFLGWSEAFIYCKRIKRSKILFSSRKPCQDFNWIYHTT